MGVIVFLLIITTIIIMICIHIYKMIRTKIYGFSIKQWIRYVGIFIIMGIILAFISGYRLSPLAASRANGFIEKEFELMDEIDLDWAYFHFYYDDDNDMYYTTISEKKFLMYVSHNSVWHYGNKNDPIKTIGGMSYKNGSTKSANLLMVTSDDENIHSIIVRQESKIIETKINVDEPQIIVIDNFTYWSSIDVFAVDKFGKEIYYYGYPKDTNIMKSEDYKWHKVKMLSDTQ